MEIRSKYTSLTSIPDGYTREEWELIVSVIDFLPLETLRELCTEYGIDFGNRNMDVDEDQMVAVLTGGDITKDETLEIANRYRDGRPAS